MCFGFRVEGVGLVFHGMGSLSVGFNCVLFIVNVAFVEIAVVSLVFRYCLFKVNLRV